MTLQPSYNGAGAGADAADAVVAETKPSSAVQIVHHRRDKPSTSAAASAGALS